MTQQANEVRVFVSGAGEGAGWSHALLERAAARYLGGATTDFTLDYGERGKPRFAHAPQVHFNITHSGAYWMCAFSPQELGLDLQVHRPCRWEKLSKRFFHPAEASFLKDKGPQAFFDLWAAKESYAKYTGQGIAEGFGQFSLVDEVGRFPVRAGAALRLLPWLDGYSMCLCAKELSAVQICRMEP